MVNTSRRYGLPRQRGRAIDLAALLLSAVVTASGAVAAAWWYGISWHDITSGGFAGLFVFAGMFALFLGMPAYYLARLVRAPGRPNLQRHP